MNMATLDDLLGPRLYHVIDDGDGGQWEISLRPRKYGSPIVRATVVSFHRLDSRSTSGFGVQLWALRTQAVHPQELRDPIVDSSIDLTQAAAKNAVAWVDSLEQGKS